MIARSVLAAAGAVLFLEKVSPALEQVDSSSGAIGTAVNHAIEILARIIIADAPTTPAVSSEPRSQSVARARAARARLVRKVYEADPLACRTCKGPMRVGSR